VTALSLTQVITSIVHQTLPDAEVLFFGSRVKNTHRPNSDIDILIRAPAKLTFSQLAHLNETLMESNIPYVVDLHDYHGITADFLATIQADLVSQLPE
jgi:predicted nucleotidyltransferase